MFSCVEKIPSWLHREKSYEISNGFIFLSILILSFIVGWCASTRFDRSRNDRMWLNHVQYRMKGLMQVPDHKDLYLPVYEQWMYGNKTKEYKEKK